MKLFLLVAVLAAAQLAVLSLCFPQIRKRFARTSTKISIAFLVLAEGGIIAAMILGAYGEARWQAFTAPDKLLTNPDDTSGAAIPRVGNPALLATLDAQAPPHSPFEAADRKGFEGWQKTLRRTLVEDVYGIDDISTVGAVTYTKLSTTVLDGGTSRTLLSFSAFDGVEIPAYLFVPAEPKTRPGILVIPGHVKEYESGIAQTGEQTESYQHAAALRLAEAGYVTLTFELRGFGRLGNVYGTEHRLVAYNAILAGTFYKAVIARDIKRAIDLLQSIPNVDPTRIGITGASYGGEMAVAYASLDPRIKVIVFQAYGGRVGLNPGVTGTKEDQPHYDHLVPGANRLFRTEDIFLLLAPRPTLGVRGNDKGFRDPSFRSMLEAGWEITDNKGLLRLRTENGGHEYFVDPAIDFFREHL